MTATIPPRITPLASALAAALAVLAVPASAGAAPDWTPATTLTGHGNPSLGFAGGEQTESHTELLSLDPLRTRIVVTSSRPGEETRTQIEISTTTAGFPVDSKIAVAPSGQAVLVWREVQRAGGNGTPSRFHVRYRTPAGDWEADRVVLSDALETDTTGPSLTPAIGRDGTAAVVIDHHETDDPGEAVHDQRTDVVVHPAGGDWESPFRLSTPNRSSNGSDIGVDAAGNITATYAERYSESGGRGTAIMRRRSASNKVWTTPEDLTQSAPNNKGFAPNLDVAPDGRAVIALQRDAIAVAATRDSASSQFGPLTRVSPEGAVATARASGLAPDGTAYAAYEVTSGAPTHVGIVRAAPGGSFSAPRRISPTGMEATQADIAFAGPDAVIGWTGHSTSAGTDVVQGTRWAASSAAPDAFHDLDSNDGSSLAQAVGDGEGSAAVVWASGLDTHVAAFDAGGPTARSADVPQTATAGQSATLRGSFADRWSPLAGDPTWDFGDGASASGAEVGHAWAAAGDYTVTLRSADTLGNASERRFAVHVDAAAAGAPAAPPAQPQAAPQSAPTVTLKAPRCPRKLSKAACKRFLVKPSTWKQVRGTTTGAERVTLTVKRKGAKTTKVSAAVKAGKWVAKLKGLKPGGTTTITAQALGAGGQKSKPVARKLRLRR